VYIADFGTGRLLTDMGTVSTATSSGSLQGTFGFQSPEVLKGATTTTASDVYSLGCVFIELFAMRRVWPGLAATAIMCNVAVLNQQPSTSDIKPVPIQKICEQCTSIEPSGRPEVGDIVKTFACTPPAVLKKLLEHAYSFFPW